MASEQSIMLGENENELDTRAEQGSDSVVGRVRFGGRLLKEPSRVYDHNSWDHIEWDSEQLEKAKSIVANHRLGHSVSLCTMPGQENQEWNKFYARNDRHFFKDRHWFEIEFSELFFSNPSQERLHILEVGCGAGNSIFPILKGTEHRPNLFVTGCDFSQEAIQLVQSDARYDPKRVRAFVYDVASATDDFSAHGLEEHSVDMILLVFVLSALSRDTMRTAIGKMKRVLKPGGMIFFRDYGLYDLAQLRLQSKHWVQGNQYRRGDGTLMYFFTLDEVRDLFTEAGFQVQQLGEDKRLLVNRKRQLQMYRVWLQGKFFLPRSIT